MDLCAFLYYLKHIVAVYEESALMPIVSLYVPLLVSFENLFNFACIMHFVWD
jgi:hypothetical protein